MRASTKTFIWALLGLFLLFCARERTQREKIYVGVIAPLETVDGDLLFKAAKMSAAEINAQGGILEKDIVLVPIDDANNLETAQRNLYEVRKNHPLNFLIGGFTSAIVLGLMENIADDPLVWLGTGAAHPDVIERIKNNYQKYKFYFRLGTTDARLQAKYNVDFIMDKLVKEQGLKKFALLGTDLKFSRFVLGYIKTLLIQNGLRCTYESYFDAKTENFKKYFHNSVKSGAQFIISLTLGKEGTTYIRQYHDLKVPLPEIGNHVLANRLEWWEETEGKCAFNVHMRTQSGYFPYTRKTLAFYDQFLKTYKNHPAFLSFTAYDSLYIIREIARKIDSLNTDKFIAALEKLDYLGNVRYRFTEHHDIMHGTHEGKKYIYPVFFQWHSDAKIYPVWPPEAAKRTYSHPDWIKLKVKNHEKTP